MWKAQSTIQCEETLDFMGPSMNSELDIKNCLCHDYIMLNLFSHYVFKTKCVAFPVSNHKLGAASHGW